MAIGLSLTSVGVLWPNFDQTKVSTVWLLGRGMG